MRRGDGSDNSMEQSLTDAESQQQQQMFDKGDIVLFDCGMFLWFTWLLVVFLYLDFFFFFNNTSHPPFHTMPD